MRKLFILFIAVIMLLSLMLPYASAETTTGEDGWRNILILGGDARSTTDYQNTDVMLILSINTEISVAKLTSIMRDTIVEIPGQSSEDRINSANVYGGPELAMKTVNSCFEAGITDYMIVNMYDLVNIIDLLGGVDIDVDASERVELNRHANEYLRNVAAYDGTTQLDAIGTVHVNGLLAVSYVRDFDSDSDFQRVMRQQEVMISMLKQAQNMNVDDLMTISNQIFDHLSTSLTHDEMHSLGQVLLGVNPASVSQYRIPADGTFEIGTFDDYWCIRPDFEQNAALLHQFIYGK